jgi:two-component system chemotaxis sensor kinase CheA
MATDPYKYFRLEVRELLDQLGEALLELERSQHSAAAIQRLLRLAHTLKGAARVVKQVEIADQAHGIEDELSAFRAFDASAPPELIEAITGRVDRIGALAGALAPAEGAPAPAREDAPPADEALRTVRTDIAEMDALLEGVAEAHVLLHGLRPAAQMIERSQHLAGLLLEQLDARGAGRPGPVAQTQAHSTAVELRNRLGGLERSLSGAVEQIDRELRQLRVVAEQLRLVSASTLFTTLERTARETARAMGKQVTFEAKGGDIRLDAHVLAGVQNALIQIVRNAVAHGIEAEPERLAAHKPSAGRITLNVARRGRKIVFECRDDGRGVDLDAVRRIAASRGPSGAQVEQFGAEELVRLLLRGGITTSTAVTETSGRGVGLDVVREAIERLAGEVVFHTEAGQGVTFELVVPLSLAAVEALVVEVGERAVTIPFDAVRQSMLVGAADVSRTATGSAIIYKDAAIPFVSLPRLLTGIQAHAERSWPVVIVAGAGGLAAVGVDRLLGSARVVVRPLPDSAPASAIVAGASLDAEGNPQLMLEPDGLVAEARQGDASDLHRTAVRLPVLVIDDSLTTRMLEQSILESAGYEVELATSAEEGLEKARRTPHGVFLVDVEMPGMDGFTFVERTRLDPTLRDTPAILVTSRDAPEDRQRGLDAGARGYIVKGQFDQAELLKKIRELMS